VPQDFQIDVTVLAGETEQGDRPIDERTARYILAPGGDLHFSAGPDLTTSASPGYVRTLEPAAVAQIWAIAAGQISHSAVHDVPNIELVQAGEGQLTRLIIIQARGDRWFISRTRPIGGTESPDHDRLIRTLAAFAWATDAPDIDILRVPIRYDFGPDPYDRYRSVGAAANEAPQEMPEGS